MMREADVRDRSRSRERERDRSGTRGDKRPRSRGRSRERSSRKKGSNCRVFVSNISYDCRWQDLKDLFRSHVGEVSYVELFNDENDKPRGCGIVEFADEKSVKKCLEVMHRLDCKGRKLVVREDFNEERDRHGRIMRRDRERDRSNLPDLRDEIQLPSLLNMSTSSQTPDYGNTYGLSHKFLESLGINGPLINRVFVANLDYKVTEKKLQEVFKLAGKVLSVEITQDKDGNSRGFGVVEYDHPVEAVQAISMFNSQQLYDRKLIVRMDRDKNDGLVRLPEGLRNVGLGLGMNGEPLRDVSRYLASNSINMSSIKPKNSLLDSVSNPVLQSGLNPATAVALNNVITPNLLSLANSQAAALQASLANVGNLSNSLLSSNLNMNNELNLANLTSSNLLNASLNQNQALASFASSNSNTNFSQRPLDSVPNFNNVNYTTIHSDRMNRDDSLDRDKDRDQSSGSRIFKSEDDNDYNRQTAVYSTINNGSQSRSQSQRNDTVLISNLHPSTTWNAVREKFRSFGDLLNVEVKGSNAIVQFSDPRHAEQAIMHFRGSSTDVKYF